MTVFRACRSRENSRSRKYERYICSGACYSIVTPACITFDYARGVASVNNKKGWARTYCKYGKWNYALVIELSFICDKKV